jgi:5'-nucleotidase
MANILLTNDDGIHAKGLLALAEVLSPIHNVYVSAPDRERSAAAHNLTLHQPILVYERELEYPVKRAIAVAGSPCDCVKLALNKFYHDIPFDFVVSGINNGPNLGTDIIYSGTVSAASEGSFLGIPSLALSLMTGHLPGADFAPAAQFVRDYLASLQWQTLPPKMLLNINIPGIPLDKIEGVAVTTLAERLYIDTYDERHDPRNTAYYWLVGQVVRDTPQPGSDIEAVFNNRVSVTPITFGSLVDRPLYEQLRQGFQCES